MGISAHTEDWLFVAELDVLPEVPTQGRVVGIELGLEADGIVRQGYVLLRCENTTIKKKIVIDRW
ncbi:MAG: hypothetical protein WC455_22555 [Dehalococcoidia bacterium]|jgi:hypothetical protein